MKINIISERKWEDRSFYQVAWEWEDAMLQYFQENGYADSVFTYVRSPKSKLLKAFYKYFLSALPLCLRRISRKSGTISIYTPYRVWHCNQFLSHSFIPIFIDVYDHESEKIYQLTKHLPFFFVTSMDTYHQIKDAHPESTVQFMAQSIADKWVTETVPQKTIDVIQIGRKSELLHTCMLEYCKKHPEVNYVYSQGRSFYSTATGDIGQRRSREEFMELLGSARVCLISTPGVTTHRFGNVDFFTARIYESAARFCRLIGHYSDNEEAQILGIPSICPNVHNQEEFDCYMEEALGKGNISDVEKDFFLSFIRRHTTSARAQQIINCVIKYETSQIG